MSGTRTIFKNELSSQDFGYMGRRVPAKIVAVGMLVNVNLLVNQK